MYPVPYAASTSSCRASFRWRERARQRESEPDKSKQDRKGKEADTIQTRQDSAKGLAKNDSPRVHARKHASMLRILSASI